MNKAFTDLLVNLVIFIIKIRNAVFRYFYFSNFEKKHVTYGFVNGKFQITSTSHEDFIAAIQSKINKLSGSNDHETFIRLALTEAIGGCNFIIFSPPDHDNKYVQFWTGDHTLKYDFCAIKTNGLKKYYYSVLGLLSESGFVNQKIVTNVGKRFFEIEKTKNQITVDANFGVDIESASKFTEAIYKQIYKVRGKKLIARVE